MFCLWGCARFACGVVRWVIKNCVFGSENSVVGRVENCVFGAFGFCSGFCSAFLAWNGKKWKNGGFFGVNRHTFGIIKVGI